MTHAELKQLEMEVSNMLSATSRSTRNRAMGIICLMAGLTDFDMDGLLTRVNGNAECPESVFRP
jgi:hypothetical protein